MHEKSHIRRAVPGDVSRIQRLLAHFAADRLLLPRKGADIAAHLENFIVAEKNGRFAGCCAVRDYGNSLFEVRSLAVLEEFGGHGIGSELVKYALDRLREHGKCRVFALTYRGAFFRRLGFHTVDKEMFPEKIWSDCANCPKKDKCDEEALLLDID